MKDYRNKALKAIETFGDKWGRYTEHGFVYYKPTVEEITGILNEIYHWFNAPNVFEKAIDLFRCHAQMDDYPDYELGYISNRFKNDVATILNTREERMAV